MSVFGDAQNATYLTKNRLKFTVRNATSTGMIFIITMPNTTGIDLREAAELNSTKTFSVKYTNSLQMFRVLRFSSWSVGREADYNPTGLATTDSEWETRYDLFYSPDGQRLNFLEIDFLFCFSENPNQI
jgi:hypothetical protein